MYKNKENYNSYMKEYMKNKRNNGVKTAKEQIAEFVGSPEDHCIDEAIYDKNCPKWRSDKEYYTKPEVEDNFKWVEQYLIKIGRFKKK